MDNSILKKKLSTFRSQEGYLIGVTTDVLFEVLRAWEDWSGSTKDFYRSIGVSQRQMAVLLGKAKKMAREGGFPAEEFREVKVVEGGSMAGESAGCGIELSWEQGKVIRFRQVEQLVEFLKKVAA
jgi:hypothetical protein